MLSYFAAVFGLFTISFQNLLMDTNFDLFFLNLILAFLFMGLVFIVKEARNDIKKGIIVGHMRTEPEEREEAV